jgi:hypothetical protein
MGTEMVDIYVGPSKVLFRLYKSRICARISYFDKMFNGNFKEASENTAYLPEDSPASFDLLADWANHPTEKKCPRRIRELETVLDDDEQEVASWDAVGFYSLAEKYCLPELQDIIMDKLLKYQKRWNELPSVEFTIRAYEQTSVGSPLANYCTRAMAYIVGTNGKDNGLEEHWPTSDIARLNRELPNFAEALLRVQREMAQDSGVSDPRVMRSCGFHAHAWEDYCAAKPHRKIPCKKRKAQDGEEPDRNKRSRVGTSESVEDAE